MAEEAAANPYRLALFDFDGTLADSFALFREAYGTLASRHGFRHVDGDEEVRELRAMHARDIMRSVGLPMWKLPAVASEFIGIMRARRSEVHPFPGTLEMLTRLRGAGIDVAVVSSNARDNVEAILGPAATSLVGHFACGMSMFGKRAHLRQALAMARVEPREAIYIGDQAADLEAARGEGIDFGAVAWGYGVAAHLASLGAAHVFQRMEDIGDKLAPR